MPVMSSVEAAFCRSAPWRTFARQVVLPWALSGRPLRGDVLEIGGGSGAMAAAVAQEWGEVRLTVTDLDEAMVASARRRLRAFSHVEVVQADVLDLPFDAGRFDVVTSYLMLHHVIRWPEALSECARVLRSGGMLIGYDLTDTWLARAIHRIDGSPHRIVSPDELLEQLALAGFEDVSVELAWGSHVMRFRAQSRADL